MHLLLTDRLSCPRCGPPFGLILLAREVRDRRIIHGDFGWANCRETYPVEDGFGDLRAPPRGPLDEMGAGGEEGEEGVLHEPAPDDGEQVTLRLAALMGVTSGPGTLLMRGPVAVHAGSLARMIGGVELVALDPTLRSHPEEEGVSRMVARPGLPFFSGSLRAVLLSGLVEDHEMEEAVRVLASRGRLVVMDASPRTRGWVEGKGFRIILDQDGVLVGERESHGGPQLVTLRGT